MSQRQRSTPVAAAMLRHLGVEARNHNSDPQAKALLAHLRDGGRRPIGDHVVTWATVCQIVPAALGGDAEPSMVEQAVFDAITLHATHAQANAHPAHQRWVGLGTAMGRLASGESSTSSRLTHLHALIGAATYEELRRHLRSVITLLRRDGIGLDYIQLVQDLIGFADEGQNTSVRLRWGRDMTVAMKRSEIEKKKHNQAEPSADENKEN